MSVVLLIQLYTDLQYLSCGVLGVMRFLYNDDLTFLNGTLNPDEEIDILITFSVDAAYFRFIKTISLKLKILFM